MEESVQALEESVQALLDGLERLREISGQRNATVLITIDQFEEVFGDVREDQIGLFAKLLARLLEQEDVPLMVLGTLRSDFFGTFQMHPILRNVPYNTLTVGPMGPENIAQVIQKPAELAGVELESGLMELLVKDTQTGNALPLLAFTLQELYERYGKDDQLLEISEYKAKLGGLKGSLAKAAQTILDSYAAPRDPNRKQTEASLHSAFMKLVRIDERGKRARRLASWQDMPSSIHPLLQKFVKGRLLVSSGDENSQVLEVSHEALLSSWPLLDQWIIDSEKLLLQRQKIEARAEGWKNDQEQSDLLLKGKGLREVEWFTQQDGKDLTLSKIGNEFVQASVKQRKKFRRKLAGVFGVLCLGGLGWGGKQVWLCCTPHDQIHRVREELVKPLGRIDDEFVTEASIALGKVGHWEEAISIVKRHTANNNTINTKFLTNMANVALRIDKISESSEILEKAVATAQMIEDSSYKSYALREIAEAYGQLKDDDSAQAVLEKAVAAAQTIEYPSDKSSALSAIAEAYGKLEKWNDALRISQKISAEQEAQKVSTLAQVLTFWAEKHNPKLVEKPTPEE